MDVLPIVECLPQVIEAALRSQAIVLRAPPGAGKTTGVPPALLHAGAVGDGQVLLIQPRRLAARAAASRLSKSMGVTLGREVGYHVRFDKRVSAETRLVAMTTGVLLRRLQSDPLLEDVTCVLLDEFHERSLEADLALGMIQRIRGALRPELRLIVMSATLDPAPIVRFLGDAKAVESQGRSFPVQICHADVVAKQPIEQQVAEVIPRALRSTPGDLLVFLPGVGEIRRTKRTIAGIASDAGCDLMELYGDLSPSQQDRVLREAERRKIILSTNVAETSVTIPGVTGVIDTGLARVMRFDSQVGLPKLQLEPISQASAEQRAGRAGRTEPGVCFRTWPSAAHRARRERDLPEIQRGDFSSALLMLTAWGERNVESFPWLTPPPAEAVASARRLLMRIGAIDNDGILTEMGRPMLRLPLHPRLSRFLMEASRLGVDDDAALAAALLTERNPFGSAASNSDRHLGGECDVQNLVDQMKQFRAGDSSVVENGAAARQVDRVARQLLDLARHEELEADPNRFAPDGLRRALLAAYPDRVARRRSQGSDRGRMVGGRGVRLDRRSAARNGELFLCIDVDSGSSEAVVRVATSIEACWLDPRLIREQQQFRFDSTLEAVVARRVRKFADLVLSEVPIECQPSAEVAELLADAARSHPVPIWPGDDDPAGSFVRRVRFLIAEANLPIPPLDDSAMESVLRDLCQSRTSIAELRAAPWLDHLHGRYDYQQLQLIEREAPSRITVPSGNAISIQYADGKPPTMSVRIQELYGWKQAPRVAAGRVAVQLHLLGPNHRPQQVTDDLASFWSETYSHVRKELKRRYPKHHWPDDPTTATATRNGLKPRP